METTHPWWLIIGFETSPSVGRRILGIPWHCQQHLSRRRNGYDLKGQNQHFPAGFFHVVPLFINPAVRLRSSSPSWTAKWTTRHGRRCRAYQFFGQKKPIILNVDRKKWHRPLYVGLLRFAKSAEKWDQRWASTAWWYRAFFGNLCGNFHGTMR